jgi:membrane-associated protease RseP (regulator of RpoE activity)
MRQMPFQRISGRRFWSGRAAAKTGTDKNPLIDSAAVLTMAITGWLAIVSVTPAADDLPADFRPQDISIGEPISLPFATPLAAPAPGRPASPPAAASTGVAVPVQSPSLQPPAAQLPSVVVPAQPFAAAPASAPVDVGAPLQPALAGTGWLGIAVDDTVMTGRLVVVEVAPDGPAAQAGVRPQDVLLAINGSQLRTSDELAAVLAAIVPGQRVKMAVGRDSRIDDVVAQASARPPEAVSRDWQSVGSATAPSPAGGLPARAAAVDASPLVPGMAAPSRLVPESTSVGVLPAPAVTVPPQAVPDMLPANAGPAQAATEGLPPYRSPSLLAAPAGRTALGVRTVPVDPNVQSRFRLSDAHGAFVIGVVQDLPAAKAGVPPGSVIVAINHQPVRSPQDLTQLVTQGPVGRPVPIQYILPGGQSKQADVVLQSLEQPLERALVGSDADGQSTEPPSLQPSPLTTRRVQPTVASTDDQATNPDQLGRLEQLLRRLNTRLDQIERRLERIETAR